MIKEKDFKFFLGASLSKDTRALKICKDHDVDSFATKFKSLSGINLCDIFQHNIIY